MRNKRKSKLMLLTKIKKKKLRRLPVQLLFIKESK